MDVARVAESAGLGKDDEPADAAKMNQSMGEVRAGREEVQQLTARMTKRSLSTVHPRPPTPERRQPRLSCQDPHPDVRRQRHNGPRLSTKTDIILELAASLQFKHQPSIWSVSVNLS